MPLYEYQCDACGHRFETIQKFSDPPLAECPKCGGTIHKLQSAPAFQFKGSGWYITDYARKDAAPSDGAPSGTKGESKDSKATETKSDEKSEKKTEQKTEKKSDTKSDAAPSSSDSKTT